MNGATQGEAIRWAPDWPASSQWFNACALASIIGIGLGVNERVWPWTQLTPVPRTAFWLVLSLLTALQWTLAAALLPKFGNPGWLQKVVRPVIILLALSPLCGIEFTVVAKLIGLVRDVPFTDASTRFSQIFLEWAVVLVLPVALIGGWRTNQSLAPLPALHAVATPDDPPGIVDDLQRKLPLRLRGQILALKAEDHYVRVFTDKGDTLVLARFADAALQLVQGLQVHRSYWVHEDAIEAVARNGRRFELRLKNGLVVPVSRAYEREIKARQRGRYSSSG